MESDIMKEKVVKKTKILRKKEFLFILLIFFTLTISFLVLNLSLSYSHKLKGNKEIVNLISETIVEDFDESLNEINDVSKKVFLEEDFFTTYDQTRLSYDNEEMTSYLYGKFEEYRTDLIRGMGFILDLSGDTIVYSGAFNDMFYKDL